MTSILDRFLPAPQVAERFEITIRAPASLVMDVATTLDMQSIASVKAIFRARELLMGSARGPVRKSQGILAETAALGWGVLAAEPGHFVACGALCQPWLADVRFTPVPADESAACAPPDQVKIVWSLEALSRGPALTRFAQETRAMGTDAGARLRFRRYWRWARFGIVAIRLLLLPAVRREAERRWKVESENGQGR